MKQGKRGSNHSRLIRCIMEMSSTYITISWDVNRFNNPERWEEVLNYL